MDKSNKESGYIKDLGDGLILRTAANTGDIERVAECSMKVFGEEGIGWMHRKLFTQHPYTKPDHLIFVEDEKTGKVISTICLLPWEIYYDEVRLKVGEMGIVGTIEPYRRRGLIRAQAEYHRELLNQEGFDLSVIQGIPYFYRQFGYEYSIPLEGGFLVEFHQISDLQNDEKEIFTFRNANSDDIPILKRIHNESSQELDIHIHREESIWRYFLEYNPITQTGFEIWVVENDKKEVIGYFHIQKYPFGKALTVNEVSSMSYDAMMAVLRQLKKLAIERNKPNIRLCLPASCGLSRLAKYFGAHDTGNYAWQIYVPDMARLLRSIAPVLEKRIAKSPFTGFTESLKLSFYEEAFNLNFEDGKIIDIQKLEKPEGSVRIPPRAAIPLIFGYRSREELENSWTDLDTPPKEAYLIDVMFPKMTAWIYTVY